MAPAVDRLQEPAPRGGRLVASVIAHDDPGRAASRGQERLELDIVEMVRRAVDDHDVAGFKMPGHIRRPAFDYVRATARRIWIEAQIVRAKTSGGLRKPARTASHVEQSNHLASVRLGGKEVSRDQSADRPLPRGPMDLREQAVGDRSHRARVYGEAALALDGRHSETAATWS